MNASRTSVPSLALAAGCVILALGAGIALGRYVFKPGTESVNRRPDNSPARGEVRTVVARGRLEPDGGVINIGVAGDRLARVVVREGDVVNKGAELAYLESHPDRLADYNLARAQLEEANRRLKAVKDACQSTIEEAQIKKEQVEKVEPLDIQAQDARVRLLTEQLANAKTDLSRLQALKLDSVPQQQLEMQTLAVRKAEEELVAARALLDKTKKGHELSLRAAEAQVRAAKANEARYISEIAIDAMQKTVDLAEARLRHTIIRAPSDGKILKLVCRAGEMLTVQPILMMGNTQKMTAIAEVYETDVQYIAVGNAATITSPALAKPITGKVSAIGSIVSKNRLYSLDPTAAADQRVVDVTIELDPNTPAESFVNLQVTVNIKTSAK
jgi:HlyD family secretion protein